MMEFLTSFFLSLKNQVQNTIPETLKIINILFTLPLAIASSKSLFSSLKLTKSHIFAEQ